MVHRKIITHNVEIGRQWQANLLGKTETLVSDQNPLHDHIYRDVDDKFFSLPPNAELYAKHPPIFEYDRANPHVSFKKHRTPTGISLSILFRLRWKWYDVNKNNGSVEPQRSNTLEDGYVINPGTQAP